MESLPLREYELVRATDPDEIREMTERLFAPHRLILTGRQMRLDARLHCCRLIDTAIGFVAYGGEVRIEAEPTDTYFTIGLAHAGEMDVRCRGADSRSAHPLPWWYHRATMISPPSGDAALCS